MTIRHQIGLLLAVGSVCVPALAALLYAATQAVKETIRDRRCSFFEGAWIALWPAIAVILLVGSFTIGVWLMN